jgi:ABC-type phosphate/phosphonate transport system substrate-binding protein
MKQRTAALASSALCLALATVPAPATDRQSPSDPIKVGMSKSIFVDVPSVLVQIIAPWFNALTKECTGLNGHMVVGGDCFELCKKLERNEVQLTCLQGIEYAWVHEKHPDMVPMMVAIYCHHQLKANLVVRKDSSVSGFGDLRGKDLAYPMKSKEHCRLFLDRHCNECGQCDPGAFFSQVTRPASMEGALDDVCGGRSAACIVDAETLEYYQNLKPGCRARLRVVKQSETFPPAVICYRKGVLSEETLAKFRNGMILAHKNEKNREMMAMFMITSFEPLPTDYFQTVGDILKTYPSPEPGAKLSRKN